MSLKNVYIISTNAKYDDQRMLKLCLSLVEPPISATGHFLGVDERAYIIPGDAKTRLYLNSELDQYQEGVVEFLDIKSVARVSGQEHILYVDKLGEAYLIAVNGHELGMVITLDAALKAPSTKYLGYLQKTKQKPRDGLNWTKIGDFYYVAAAEIVPGAIYRFG